jgi:O-acetyl-ADP-ribose deacetylase (regulator of RNase III)
MESVNPYEQSGQKRKAIDEPEETSPAVPSTGQSASEGQGERDTHVQVVDGDVLESTERYVAHQCNCVSKEAIGLAQQIFEKYPYANTYSRRTGPRDHSKPGTVDVMIDDDRKERFVINMYAQRYPGAPKGDYDSEEKRKGWFRQCLEEMSKIEDMDAVAFPFFIGAGLAQGSWKEYKELIDQFAKENPKIKVSMYKKALPAGETVKRNRPSGDSPTKF